MRWLKPNLSSSIYAIFAASAFRTKPEPDPEIGVEEIQVAMLALLPTGGGDRFPQFTRRVRHAADLVSLWFLRGELMAVLSSRYGESAALEQLEGVSDMFGNLLPQGLKSRPSPLNSRNLHLP